eukprot:3505489-Pleurochrysis_carterae.AAC.2
MPHPNAKIAERAMTVSSAYPGYSLRGAGPNRTGSVHRWWGGRAYTRGGERTRVGARAGGSEGARVRARGCARAWVWGRLRA